MSAEKLTPEGSAPRLTSPTGGSDAAGGGNRAQHTPAPWVIQGYRIYGPPDARSKHGNGRALIGGVVDDGVDWRATQLEIDGRGAFHAETMANARLIAAAPELLAVLRSLITDNAQDTIEDPLGHADRERANLGTVYKGTLDAARAAIAKATGGTP